MRICIFLMLLSLTVSLVSGQQFAACDSTHGYWIATANDTAYALALSGKITQTTRNNILVCNEHVTQLLLANALAYQPEGKPCSSEILLKEFANQEVQHQSVLLKSKLKLIIDPDFTGQDGTIMVWWYAMPAKEDETIRHQVFAALKSGNTIVSVSCPHPKMASLEAVKGYLVSLLSGMRIIPERELTIPPFPCP